MKEATSELNLTVIVLVAVGVLAAFFFTILWPMIDNNFKQNASCRAASCDCSKETRDSNERDGKGKNMCKCSVEKDAITDVIYCPYGG